MSQRRLPAEIYWRRRLLALAVLILLIWAALRLWPDGDSEPVAATPRPTPAATQPPATTDGTMSVSLASADKACDPESIRVTPSVAGGQHNRGPVDVNLLVSSTSRTPCTFTAGSSDLLVVISAGKTPVWDSTVCKTALITKPVQIAPGWATNVDTTWTGQGSGNGCSSKEGYVTPGTYVLKIGTLGGEPGRTTFRLTSAPKPKKTPTPEPSASASAKKKSA